MAERAQTHELRANSPAELAARAENAPAARLDAAGVSDLEALWCEFPSRIGLGSSLAGQLATLQQFSRVQVKATKGPGGAGARPSRAPTMTDALVDHLAESAGGKLPSRKERRAQGRADAKAARQAVPEGQRAGVRGTAFVGVPNETPAEALERRAAAAAAHFPHALDLPPEELPEAYALKPIGTRGMSRWWNARDGLHGDFRPGDIRAARNVKDQTIHCAGASTSSGCCRMVPVTYRSTGDGEGMTTGLVEAPLRLEEWVDKPTMALRRKLATARRALIRMLRDGDQDLVAVLYAVYGGAVPDGLAPPHLRGDEENGGKGAAGSRWEFPELGDLSPIVTHTRSVQQHAARMTARLRGAAMTRAGEPSRLVQSTTRKHEAAWLAGGDVIDLTTGEAFTSEEMRGVLALRSVVAVSPAVVHLDRRESVSLRTAAHDLLDTKGHEATSKASDRIEARNRVRREAESLLVRAGRAYRAAHRAEVDAMRRDEGVRAERVRSTR